MTTASAQVTINYTFTAGTVADPDQVNDNFNNLATKALNRTGGTMTGALTSAGGSLAGTWSGSPTFSGTPTMSGTTTYSGTLTSSGGTLSGTWAGSPTFTGSLQLSGDLVFTGGLSVRRNTSDGADNSFISLDGGGSLDQARGALFRVFGNEGTAPGSALVNLGSVATAAFNVITGSSVTALTVDGTTANTTLGVDLLFAGSSNGIKKTTVDGSDTGFIQLVGGGAVGEARGGFIEVSGNERVSRGGFVEIGIGNVASSQFIVRRADTTAAFSVLGSDGSVTATTTAGGWLFNSTNANGGVVDVQKSGTHVIRTGAATSLSIGSGNDGAVLADSGDLYLYIPSANTIQVPQGRITFPAAQNASSNANTLDDYEEGTWTPTVSGTGGSSGITYSTQTGHYVKVGQLVVADFQVTLSAKTSITGSVQVQSLPFTSMTGWVGTSSECVWGATATNWYSVFGALGSGVTAITMRGNSNSSGVLTAETLANADIGATTSFSCTISYRASA